MPQDGLEPAMSGATAVVAHAGRWLWANIATLVILGTISGSCFSYFVWPRIEVAADQKLAVAIRAHADAGPHIGATRLVAEALVPVHDALTAAQVGVDRLQTTGKSQGVLLGMLVCLQMRGKLILAECHIRGRVVALADTDAMARVLIEASR